jgi:hypothetical protein
MNVRLPNGQILRDVPKGTTKAQAMEMALQQGLITPEDMGQESYAATGNYGQNMLAGVGKAFTDLGRGTQQLLNIGDQDALQAKIDEAKQLDQALLDAPGGTMGNVLGNIAAAAPTMFIPGANTLVGSSLVGAGLGALTPTASDESALTAPAIGAAGGAVGTLAGRALEGAARGAVSLTAPFRQGGQRAIAGRALRRAATDPDAAMNAARSYQPATPGVRPTLGEATLDPGLVSMQKAVPDPALAGEIASQHAGNREAVLGVLRDIAGTPDSRAAAVAARKTATDALYEPLESAVLPVTDDLANLLRRPDVAAAYETARQNALNRGQSMPRLDDLLAMDDAGNYLNQLDGRTVQRLKIALDTNLRRGVGQGNLVGDTLDASTAARNATRDFARNNLPGYAQADDTFAAMSKPINEMDAGQYLYERASPALNDYSAGVSRVRPQALAQTLRDGQDSLPKDLRDIPGARRLSDLLSPENQSRVDGVMRDLAREASAYDAPMVRGSDTMRNMASQNVMREVLGPLGMPENVGEALMSGASGPARTLNLLFGGTEPKIQQLVVQALRDPKLAAQLMEQTAGTPLSMFLSDALRRGVGVPSAAASVPLLQQ